MLHLSELHGAATHLAIMAVPVYAAVLVLRRLGRGGRTLARVEPWLLGAALLGIAIAGVTGLLVAGQANTMLRGGAIAVGTAHYWLGIALAVILVAAALLRLRAVRGRRPTHAPVLVAVGTLALVAVFVQGYLGGRMTYDQGVGVAGGGQFAQTASGAQALSLALAQGRSETAAGATAFSAQGLGCARCHGDEAQGLRGPPLAGGAKLDDFRRVHATGLFPRSAVSDRDFRAIDAWLRTLPHPRRPPEG